jgi:hypothetical protein
MSNMYICLIIMLLRIAMVLKGTISNELASNLDSYITVHNSLIKK